MVGGEEDEGVFGKIEPFEGAVDIANFPVHVCDGGEVDRLVFVFSGGSEVLFGDFFRGIDIPMGFVELDELNEGLLRVASRGEPADGFGSDDIGSKAGLGAFGFSIADPAGLISNLGVIVGAKVVVEAVVIHGRNVIETGLGALFLNFDERVVPFADDGGLITIFAKELGNGGFGFGKVGEAAGAAADEAINTVTVRHAAGEGGGAGGGANLGGRVEMGEGRSVFGELVEMGRFDMGVAGEAEITVAEVISHDDDDVGSVFSLNR